MPHVRRAVADAGTGPIQARGRQAGPSGTGSLPGTTHVRPSKGTTPPGPWRSPNAHDVAADGNDDRQVQKMPDAHHGQPSGSSSISGVGSVVPS
jgi:hypothetical protein